MKHDTQTHHYINGRWTQGQGEAFISTNPADNSTLWQGTNATEDEVSAAYQAARNALPPWAHLDISSRIQHIRQFAGQVSNKHLELSRLIALETGKPWWEAQTETTAVIAKAELSIQAYHERTTEKQTVNQDITQALRFKPHGVVAVLGPFNFPAHLSNGHIIPALLAGNTVVYKPSELTPAVAAFMMACWHDSGLPRALSIAFKEALKRPSAYWTKTYRASILPEVMRQAGSLTNDLANDLKSFWPWKWGGTTLSSSIKSPIHQPLCIMPCSPPSSQPDNAARVPDA